MKTVSVVRHIHFEDLGVLADVLTSLSFEINYIEAPTADFTSLDPLKDDLLIVLGAPIGAFDESIYPFIEQELAFIDQRLTANKPLLGICLGAQFIARLLGAKVYAMATKEIGFGVMQIAPMPNATDNLLIALQGIAVLHWHGDQFDIPDDCTSLASTALCPNQAFAFGNNVLALQFHMEANPLKIERWLVGHATELHGANSDVTAIRHDAAVYGASLTAAAKKVFSNWLERVEQP